MTASRWLQFRWAWGQLSSRAVSPNGLLAAGICASWVVPLGGLSQGSSVFCPTSGCRWWWPQYSMLNSFTQAASTLLWQASFSSQLFFFALHSFRLQIVATLFNRRKLFRVIFCRSKTGFYQRKIFSWCGRHPEILVFLHVCSAV